MSIVLCALFSSALIAPVSSAASDSTLLTICTSLKTGHQLISETGKCNERIYESSTWYQKGSAPAGTPGSTALNLATCLRKSSGLQIIRTHSTCNSINTTTAFWQRPLGPPVAPSIASVVMGLLGTATLNITAPTQDGGAKVTSYLVTSSPAAVAATYTPEQIKEAKITGLTPGITYSFSVVAINIRGPSLSSIASAPTRSPTIPSAPGITKAIATETNSAQLSFSAPLDNGGSPITSYVATSSPASLQTTVYQSDGGTINITNLACSTTYTFILKAINAAGSSLASVISPSIATAICPPEPAAEAPTPTPALAAPAFTLSSSSETRTVNTAATGFTISSTGGAITSFGISTTPAGLSFSTITGALTGTPTSVAGATAYTITATNASGSMTRTFTLTVLATAVGPAAQVAITRASVGTARRSAFTTQPQITIQDSAGNTVTSSAAVVTATVSAGGTLVGTTTATASSGVATFTGLGVDGTIGTTYTITYTAVGLTVATATVTLTGTTCDGTFICQVGDTGPGGGIVFYVATTTFTQVGAGDSRCTTLCKYLEAAPTSGTNAWTDATYAWSGNTGSAIGAPAQGTAIGTGFANTLAIFGQSGGGNTADRAGTISIAYRGPNTLTDWYLPSDDELNQLYLQAAIVGGFVADAYWSSTESGAIFANLQFLNSGATGSGLKLGTFHVRPVRAFGRITPPIIIGIIILDPS